MPLWSPPPLLSITSPAGVGIALPEPSGGDDTAAINAVIAAADPGSLILGSGGAAGDYIHGPLTIAKPLIFQGLTRGEGGTRSTPVAGMSAGTFLFNFDWASGGDESHLADVGLRNWFVDGGGRVQDIGGVRVDRVDRLLLDCVRIAHCRRQGLLLERSVRESYTNDVWVRCCGTGSTYPQVDVMDIGAGVDGCNNITFDGCNFIFPFGTNLRIGTTNAASLPRKFRFVNTLIHAWVETVLDNGTYDYDGYELVIDQQADGRYKNVEIITCDGCVFELCSFIGSGRGQPIISMPASVPSTFSNNVVRIGANCEIGEAGPDQTSLVISSIAATAATDTFTKVAHGQYTGDLGRLTSAPPTGPTAQQHYHVIRTDADNFKLATSLANANAGIAIDITADGGGATQFTPLAKSLAWTVVAATNICTCADHGMETEAKVWLSSETTLPAPGVNTAPYFFIRIDDDTFKLATTAALARAGTEVNFTDTGTGAHKMRPEKYFANVEEGRLLVDGGTFHGAPTHAYIQGALDGTTSSARVGANAELKNEYEPWADPPLNQVWREFVITKAAMQSIASSTSLTNDTHLTFNLKQNQKWLIQGVVRYSAAPAADMKAQIIPPSNTAKEFFYTMQGAAAGLAAPLTESPIDVTAYSGLTASGQPSRAFGGLSETGTAQAGAAKTITLTAGASATDDIHVGSFIRTTGGTGSGQTNWITDYVGSTKVATVKELWATAPDVTTTYEIYAVQAITIEGYIETEQAGNLIFKWAQNASSALPTYVHAGSWLKLTRII